MKTREVLENFVKEKIGGEIFFKTANEIRFFHPNKEYKQKRMIDKLREEIIKGFNDYKREKNLNGDYVFTVSINDENPEKLVVIFGF
jgi:hypothetical protein